MSRARVPDQHGLFSDGVAALAVGGAGVDGVLEVDAFADGVAFDNFVAHFFVMFLSEVEVGEYAK